MAATLLLPAAKSIMFSTNAEFENTFLCFFGNKIKRRNTNLYSDGSGRLKKEFQTAYVLPLHFDMTKGAETKTMADNLVRLVREAGNHLTTGFTGTRICCLRSPTNLIEVIPIVKMIL